MKIKSTTLAVLATSILTLSALGCDGEGTNSPGSSGGGYADLGISLNNLDDESVSIASDTANDLHVLAFPGQPHAAGAWAARIAVPLQLIFPTVG